MAYIPYAQTPGTAGLHVELRAAVDPRPLLPAVRRIVQEFGPDLPLLQPMTQQEQFAESFADERLFARLALVFGILAAVLVATGLYGTLAYRVARRTSEIGVRIALGARGDHVLWMVLRESVVISVIGLAIGLPGAIGASRLLKSMLFGLTPNDPWSFAIATLVVGVVAIAAGLIPARARHVGRSGRGAARRMGDDRSWRSSYAPFLTSLISNSFGHHLPVTNRRSPLAS